jgi:hypothetical protein
VTIGSVISIRARAVDDERLLRHELVHVRQWRELGPVRFSVRYVGSYLRARLSGLSHRDAYLQIPFEVEARALADAAPPPG